MTANDENKAGRNFTGSASALQLPQSMEMIRLMSVIKIRKEAVWGISEGGKVPGFPCWAPSYFAPGHLGELQQRSKQEEEEEDNDEHED